MELSQAQIEQFREDGFLFVEGFVDDVPVSDGIRIATHNGFHVRADSLQQFRTGDRLISFLHHPLICAVISCPNETMTNHL